MADTIIEGKYELEEQIAGSSSEFGMFYARQIKTKKPVIVKVEYKNKLHRTLKFESQVLNVLHKHRDEKFDGFPNTYWFGNESDYNVLVLERLSDNIHHHFMKLGHFSLKTVLMFVDQALTLLQCMHHRSFIHRNLMPAFFMTGYDQFKYRVYLTEFGFAKRFRDLKTLQHIPQKNVFDDQDTNIYAGAPRYSSLNAHSGTTLSRRDDIESLALICIYFLKGELPWQGLVSKTREEAVQLIFAKKAETLVTQLCENLPTAFEQFLSYARSLSYAQRPDYDFLRGLFRDLFFEAGLHCDLDFRYDWNMEEPFDDETDTIEHVEPVLHHCRNSLRSHLSKLMKPQGMTSTITKIIVEFCVAGSRYYPRHMAHQHVVVVKDASEKINTDVSDLELIQE